MSRKKKMVFVTQNVAPFRLQWLDALSEYFDIVIYHLSDYDSSVNTRYLEISSNNLEIRTEYISFLKKKFFRYSKILDENADLILLDGYGFIGQIALIVYLKIHKIKFLMTLDGGLLPDKENKIKYLVKKFCLNSPNAILSTSEITDYFINNYKTSNAPIFRHYFSSIHQRDIYCPIVEEKLAFKRKLNLEKKFTVLAVGRFIPIKGFDILLRVAEIADSDVYFVFVGGNPPKEYLNILTDKTINNTRFVDFMDKEKLKEYYFACDVFVMPSRGDVWGLVIGEAMASGLPVISSNKCVAGLSMIQDYVNGFVINDEFPQSYICKINELKQDQNLVMHMSHNNCKLMQQYAIETSVKNDIKNFDAYQDNLIQKGFNEKFENKVDK